MKLESTTGGRQLEDPLRWGFESGAGYVRWRPQDRLALLLIRERYLGRQPGFGPDEMTEAVWRVLEGDDPGWTAIEDWLGELGRPVVRRWAEGFIEGAAGVRDLAMVSSPWSS
jgi:hypothetical protein